MSERWVWDRYWQCDRIASCFDGAGATNYDDSVAAGWRDFFAGLPSRSRVLDLCTGNGAVALLAAAAGKSFSITAVDQADIDPPSYVTRDRDELAAVRFVGRTEVESLPFRDNSFDVAISQYGVEYSDVTRTIPEIARVLGPGGQARFVVHATDGVVAANASTIIAEADLLLGEIDLIGASRRCFEACATVDGGDSSDAARENAKAAFEAFRTALQLTGAHVSKAADKMMFHNSGGVMLDAFQARRRVGYDAVFAKADTVEGEILAHRGRLQALVDSALDRAGAGALCTRLRDAGAIDTDHTPLENAEGLIGYVATARFA
jgi:ubiquinone/menaquinone biosynthesis C-methylase UbiE